MAAKKDKKIKVKTLRTKGLSVQTARAVKGGELIGVAGESLDRKHERDIELWNPPVTKK